MNTLTTSSFEKSLSVKKMVQGRSAYYIRCVHCIYKSTWAWTCVKTVYRWLGLGLLVLHHPNFPASVCD